MFLKITFLIMLAGIVVYAVMPKYEVKNVTYQSLAMSDALGYQEGSYQEKVLIRINVVTGKVENFLSSVFTIHGEVTSHNDWASLADKIKTATGDKRKVKAQQ